MNCGDGTVKPVTKWEHSTADGGVTYYLTRTEARVAQTMFGGTIAAVSESEA